MRGVISDGSIIQLKTDLPEPIQGTGEVILNVRVVGICDTDIELSKGYMGYRGILGHEFIALTESGERVTAEINNACHACSTCLAGRANHCPNRTVLGILNHDGAMADRVSVPERNLHMIPGSLEDHEAVFIEPLAAAFRVTEQVPIAPGMKVSVLGDGKLGILCVWVARLFGADVTLVGKHSEKLSLVGPGVRTVFLKDSATIRKSQDVVIDATGSTSGLKTALELVRPCGTVVLKTTVAEDHTMSLAPIVIDEVHVIGSRCGPFPMAIAALDSKAIDVRPLVGATFLLDQAEAAFREAMAPGARKILMTI